MNINLYENEPKIAFRNGEILIQSLFVANRGVVEAMSIFVERAELYEKNEDAMPAIYGQVPLQNLLNVDVHEALIETKADGKHIMDIESKTRFELIKQQLQAIIEKIDGFEYQYPDVSSNEPKNPFEEKEELYLEEVYLLHEVGGEKPEVLDQVVNWFCEEEEKLHSDQFKKGWASHGKVSHIRLNLKDVVTYHEGEQDPVCWHLEPDQYRRLVDKTIALLKQQNAGVSNEFWEETCWITLNASTFAIASS